MQGAGNYDPAPTPRLVNAETNIPISVPTGRLVFTSPATANVELCEQPRRLKNSLSAQTTQIW